MKNLTLSALIFTIFLASMSLAGRWDREQAEQIDHIRQNPEQYPVWNFTERRR